MHMDTHLTFRTPISQSSLITYCGVTMTVAEWAANINLSPSNMHWRLRSAKYKRNGWNLARALTMPPRARRNARMTEDEFELWQSLGHEPNNP